MYEMFITLFFGLALIMDSMRTMQSSNFLVACMIYFLYEIGAVDLITFQVSLMMISVVSGMYLLVSIQKGESTQ